MEKDWNKFFNYVLFIVALIMVIQVITIIKVSAQESIKVDTAFISYNIGQGLEMVSIENEMIGLATFPDGTMMANGENIFMMYVPSDSSWVLELIKLKTDTVWTYLDRVSLFKVLDVQYPQDGFHVFRDAYKENDVQVWIKPW